LRYTKFDTDGLLLLLLLLLLKLFITLSTSRNGEALQSE